MKKYIEKVHDILLHEVPGFQKIVELIEVKTTLRVYDLRLILSVLISTLTIFLLVSVNYEYRSVQYYSLLVIIMTLLTIYVMSDFVVWLVVKFIPTAQKTQDKKAQEHRDSSGYKFCRVICALVTVITVIFPDILFTDTDQYFPEDLHGIYQYALLATVVLFTVYVFIMCCVPLPPAERRKHKAEKKKSSLSKFRKHSTAQA